MQGISQVLCQSTGVFSRHFVVNFSARMLASDWCVPDPPARERCNVAITAREVANCSSASLFKMAANNPRKFEEKIAQHKLRQAQETKEFEKIMEEMSFVNVGLVFGPNFPAKHGERRAKLYDVLICLLGQGSKSKADARKIRWFLARFQLSSEPK